ILLAQVAYRCDDVPDAAFIDGLTEEGVGTLDIVGWILSRPAGAWRKQTDWTTLIEDRHPEQQRIAAFLIDVVRKNEQARCSLFCFFLLDLVKRNGDVLFRRQCPTLRRGHSTGNLDGFLRRRDALGEMPKRPGPQQAQHRPAPALVLLRLRQ